MTEIISSERVLADSMRIPYAINRTRVGNFDINYLTAGEGEPLVLIHGANFGWGMWHRNIPELAKHFRVYAIDLPNAGRSSRFDYERLNFSEDFIDPIEQFLRQRSLKDAHMIGHSIGAWVAMNLLCRGGDPHRRLVIVGAVGFSPPGEAHHLLARYSVAKFLSRTLLFPSRKNPVIKGMLKAALQNPDAEFSPEFVEYFYETVRTSPYLCLISRIIHSSGTTLRISREEMAPFRKNILVLWGKKDGIIPSNHADTARRDFGFSTHIFPEDGHVPQMESPKIFNEIARAHLCRV